MVDANAAYTLADAPHLKRLDAFDLMMIEQPLDYDDIADHAVLQRQLTTPICLDESIKTVRLARGGDRGRRVPHHQHQAGARRRLPRIDPPARPVRRRTAMPVWHGGMLESGIGRAANIHLSTLANFSLPGDVAASRRYFDPDLIDPPIEVAADGTIGVPTGAGLGVAIVDARVERATLRRLAIDARSIAAVS